jgi:uncharacterized protein YbjQ (UPF0145 family)
MLRRGRKGVTVKLHGLYLAVLSFAVASCVSVTPAGRSVRVTSDPAVVHGCTYIGAVQGRSSWGGIAGQAQGEKNSMAKLQNRAAEMGADTVLLVTSHSGGGGSQQRGEAYLCGQK